MPTPPMLRERARFQRRNAVTLKLYFTRQVDWYAHDNESAASPEAAR